MIVYKYRAKSFDGKIKKGMIAASSIEDFLSRLKSERLFCLSYTTEERNIKKKEDSLKGKELLFFCEQMSSMLTAGMTVMKSLELISKRAISKKLKKIFLLLYEEVQKGKSLSDAMKNQGEIFPKMLVNMISYGEISGNLDMAVSKMAENYSKEVKLKNSVKGAMMYPIILLCVSLLVVVILLTFVLPIILNMFGTEELPWTTKLLADFSDIIINYWYIIALVVATMILGYKAAKKNVAFKKNIDKLKLRIPIFGKLNKTIATSRFARTLASLYSSGVPLIDALGVSVKVTGNTFMEEILREVIVMVQQGIELSAAILNVKMFDSMFNSMIYVGEQSGSLDTMLVKTATYFDEQSEAALKRMVALIQPIMIVILALIVGFIILSIITPIYGMYDMVG